MPLTLTPDSSGKYPEVSGDAVDLFSGGDTITINAAGATVPAFTASAVAPSAVSLTMPVEPPNGAPLPIDRMSDLTFQWQSGGFGSAVVILSDTTTKLTCTLPLNSGSGTIPQAALSALAPGSTGNFVFAPATGQTISKAGWAIEVFVGSALTWSGAVNPQTFSYKAVN